MLLLVRTDLTIHQIPAELADVLKQRAIELHNFVPELPRREFLLDHHDAAINQYRADRNNPADAVIERQAIVHAVIRPRVHHAAKPKTPIHDAVMTDSRRLRQAGRSGCIDEKRTILDADVA